MKIPYVMRKCSTCGKWLVASKVNFSRQKEGKWGLSNMCKNCSSEYNKAYYKSHKKEILTNCKAYREANKEKISEYQREYHKEHYVPRKRTSPKETKTYTYKIKRHRWTKEDIEKLTEMYTNPEISIKEVAEYFQVSVGAILIATSKNGIVRGNYYFDRGEQKCPYCGMVLPATSYYFHRNKSNKSGYVHYCKECVKKMHIKGGK